MTSKISRGEKDKKGRRDFTTIGKSDKKKQRKKSIEQEDRYGERGSREDGLRVLMSGSGEFDGDAIWKNYLLECKRTDSSSYSVEFSELKKSYREARMSDRRWAFAIDIEGFQNQNLPERFVIVGRQEFDLLVDRDPFKTVKHRNKSYGLTENRMKNLKLEHIDNGSHANVTLEIVFERFDKSFAPNRVVLMLEDEFIEQTRDD